MGGCSPATVTGKENLESIGSGPALYVAPPANAKLTSAEASPTGAIALGSPHATLSASGFVKIPMQAQRPDARVRVVLNFTDGSSIAVQLATVIAQVDAAAAYGKHLANDAWLPRHYPDPFGRSASAMPYDREDRAIVLDDSRAYDVGLSDDAGAG